MANIQAREQALLAYANDRLAAIPGLRIFGNARDKAAVISFAVEGAHAHELSTLLDREGIAVRSGQHCAQPMMAWLGIRATCRPSLAFFNTNAEIDPPCDGLEKTRNAMT